LERRAPSRIEGGFQFKLADAALGAPFGKKAKNSATVCACQFRPEILECGGSQTGYY
jgi:hypothetical protein